MNSQGNPFFGLQPLRWFKNTEETAFWIVEQQKSFDNLSAALGGAAEGREEVHRRCRSAAIGFASIGLSNGGPAAEEGKEIWQKSKQKWVPSITESRIPGETWEKVENRLEDSPPLGFASVADGLSRDKRGRIEKIEADVRDAARESKELVKETAQDLRVPVPRKKLPVVGDVRSLTLKQLICGIISGAVAGTATSPFETLRTRAVAKRGGENAFQVLDTAAHNDGLDTFMKTSLTVATIKCALERGAQFATYEAVKRWEEREGQKDQKWLPLPRAISISTVAGAAAGVVSTLVTYPFSVLGDRTLLQPEVYNSMIGAVRTILKEEGVGGLYRGITPALLSKVPSAAATFYSYEALKRRWKEKFGTDELQLLPSLMVGAAAGAISTTLTYPLEVVRKQISMGALPLPNAGYSNMLQALREISRREGLPGLYRGVEVEWAKAVPYTAISFAVYELTKRAFVAEGEERRDEVKDAPPEASVPG